MTMPAQVRKQSEAVQKLYEEMNQDPADVNEPVEPEEPVVPPTPPVAPVAPTQVVAEDPRVNQLAAEANMLRQRLANMEALLAASPKPPAPTKPEKPAKPKLVTEADVSEYGDAIDVMRRAAREEVAALYEDEIAALRGELTQLRTQYGEVAPRLQHVQQQQTISAEQQFLSNLTSLVPNWEKVNQDAKFHEWLLETDRLSGLQRQTYLEHAQNNMDVKRVASFFEEFAAISGTSNPGAVVPTNNRREELEQQVSPGRSKTTNTGQSDKPRVYTRQDIQQFYADVARGKYKGKDQERARIETDIFAARQDGRLK